jgi:hypothetical protein
MILKHQDLTSHIQVPKAMVLNTTLCGFKLKNYLSLWNSHVKGLGFICHCEIHRVWAALNYPIICCIHDFLSFIIDWDSIELRMARFDYCCCPAQFDNTMTDTIDTNDYYIKHLIKSSFPQVSLLFTKDTWTNFVAPIHMLTKITFRSMSRQTTWGHYRVALDHLIDNKCYQKICYSRPPSIKHLIHSWMSAWLLPPIMTICAYCCAKLETSAWSPTLAMYNPTYCNILVIKFANGCALVNPERLSMFFMLWILFQCLTKWIH